MVASWSLACVVACVRGGVRVRLPACSLACSLANARLHPLACCGATTASRSRRHTQRPAGEHLELTLITSFRLHPRVCCSAVTQHPSEELLGRRAVLKQERPPGCCGMACFARVSGCVSWGYPGVAWGVRVYPAQTPPCGMAGPGRDAVLQYVLQWFPGATLPGANLRRGIRMGAPRAL